MKWEIGFSLEASNYAIDSHPYNEAMLQAIELLAFAEDGLPATGYTELEPGLYLWQVGQHDVFFQPASELCVSCFLIYWEQSIWT